MSGIEPVPLALGFSGSSSTPLDTDALENIQILYESGPPTPTNWVHDWEATLEKVKDRLMEMSIMTSLQYDRLNNQGNNSYTIECKDGANQYRTVTWSPSSSKIGLATGPANKSPFTTWLNYSMPNVYWTGNVWRMELFQRGASYSQISGAGRIRGTAPQASGAGGSPWPVQLTILNPSSVPLKSVSRVKVWGYLS